MEVRRVPHPHLDAHLRWQDGVAAGPDPAEARRFGTARVGSGWGGAVRLPCVTSIEWERPVVVATGGADPLRGVLPFQNGRLVAVTGTGTVYVVLIDGGAVNLYRRTSGSFEQVWSVRGSEQAGQDPTKATIAARGDQVAIAWATEAGTAVDGTPPGSEIRAVLFREPAGSMVATVETVSEGSGLRAGAPEACAAPSATFAEDGSLWVGWEARVGFVEAFVARRDVGGGWSRVVTSRHETGTENVDRNVQWVSVAARGPDVFAVYVYSKRESSDVYAVQVRQVFARLVAGTEAWIGGHSQGSGSYSPQDAKGPVYDPSASGGPDDLFVGWQEAFDPDGQYTVLPWSSRSADGAVWSFPVPIVPDVLLQREKFVTMATHPTRQGPTVAAWESRMNDIAGTHTIRAAVECDGAWTEVPNPAYVRAGPFDWILNRTGFPSVVVGEDDSIHLAWLEEADDLGTIWYARGRLS